MHMQTLIILTIIKLGNIDIINIFMHIYIKKINMKK